MGCICHKHTRNTDWKKFARAEIIGSLINGVFLVALCFTIFLDVIERFIDPQHVDQPKLVLCVGSAGLVINFLSLALFHEHDHGHSHGHNHSHDEEGEHHHTDALDAAEDGHGGAHFSPGGARAGTISDETGNIADVLPQTVVAGWAKSDSRTQGRDVKTPSSHPHKSKYTPSDEDDTTVEDLTPHASTSPISHRRSRSHRSRSIFQSVDEIAVHPASFRRDFIAASRLGRHSEDSSDSDEDFHVDSSARQETADLTETSPLLGRPSSQTNGSTQQYQRNDSHLAKQDSDAVHHGHHHCVPRTTKSMGHSHGDLNMRGMFLHIIGDALGNVGVIVSALIIWLTTSPARFYADPAISLIITLIILKSAIPLCLAASRIVLEAVPEDISIEEIEHDITDLPGILSVHHLRVWQLDTKTRIASMHIYVDFDFKGEGSSRYLRLQKDIDRCLREYGIKHSTIQPEFRLAASENENGDESSHTVGSGDQEDGPGSTNGETKSHRGSKRGSKAPSLRSEPHTCMLECNDLCARKGACVVSGSDVYHD